MSKNSDNNTKEEEEEAGKEKADSRSYWILITIQFIRLHWRLSTFIKLRIF
jgi:hypothetical protein